MISHEKSYRPKDSITPLKYFLSIHNVYSAKRSFFKNEDELETFSSERKLRQFVTRRPALKEMLKEVLQAKGVVLWLQENKITNKYNIISRKASQNMSIEQVTSA